MPELTPTEIVQNTIAAANRTTSATDTDLTTAVQRLRDGYGQGGGEIKVEWYPPTAPSTITGNFAGIDVFVINDNGALVNNAQNYNLYGMKKLIIDQPNRTSYLGINRYDNNGTPTIRSITVRSETGNVTTFNNAFNRNTTVETIDGVPFDGSSVAATNGFDSMFAGCQSLETVLFKKNTVKTYFNPRGNEHQNYIKFTNATHASLANALDPNNPNTFKINSRTKFVNIKGTIVNGEFILGDNDGAVGEDNLQDFITVTKGWTLA